MAGGRSRPGGKASALRRSTRIERQRSGFPWRRLRHDVPDDSSSEQSDDSSVEESALEESDIDDEPQTPPSSVTPYPIPKLLATSEARPLQVGELTVDDLDAESFGSYISSVQVTLHVGEKRKQFQVHHGLLCALVPHFKILADQKLDAPKNLYMDNDNATALNMFVTWIYRGFNSLPEVVDIGDHLNLYVRAAQWGVQSLQNLVIDKLSTWFNNALEHVLKSCVQALTKIEKLEKKALDLGNLRQLFLHHFIRLAIQQSLDQPGFDKLLDEDSWADLNGRVMKDIAWKAISVAQGLDQVVTKKALDLKNDEFYVRAAAHVSLSKNLSAPDGSS